MAEHTCESVYEPEPPAQFRVRGQEFSLDLLEAWT